MAPAAREAPTPTRARIVFVGHSTTLVDLDGVRLLTDPVLRARVAHLRRTGPVDQAALRGIDAILVSHGHADHLDLPSLERLGRSLPIVLPRGLGRLLTRRRFEHVVEVEEGDTLNVGAVEVRAVFAAHDNARLPLGARAEPLGFVLSGSVTVYFAGDTDIFPGMAEIGPVDVALVPVWGWGPNLGPGHLDPAAAAEAVALLRPKIAIPIHWGTYAPVHHGLRGRPPWLDEPPERFRAAVARVAPAVEVVVLKAGEEFELRPGSDARP